MSTSVVARLIRKDFDLSLWPMLGCLALVLAGAAVIYIGTTRQTFAFGTMLMVMGPVLVAALMSNALMVNERRDQTLAFIMSLPVTIMDYTWAKIGLALPVYFVTWGLSLALIEVLIVHSPAPPGIVAVFALLYGGLMCVSLLNMSVALITGSRRLSSAVTAGSGMVVGLGVAVFGRASGITEGFNNNSFRWTPEIFASLGGEALLAVLTLAVLLYVQARKKDFV